MWEVRPITEDEVDVFRSRLARAFGVDPDGEEGARERFLQLFDIGRTMAAFDQGEMVGTGAALSFDLTVPGGVSAPMAGTTVISVQPTHRRRGVLREMMTHHLDDAAARGEPVAGLWASESSIYGRFGYGPATYSHRLSADARSVTFRSAPSKGLVSLEEAGDAEPLMRSIYEQARSGRPGMLTRSDAWWRLRRMRDDESARRGKSARRYAIYAQDGMPSGYVAYRQKEKWDDFPEGEIHIVEMITTNAEAHRGLWGFLMSVDLFPNVEWWNAPVDDPLPHDVIDLRRIRRSISDALWIRLIDLPGALQARSYQTDGELKIAVRDDFRPDNTGTYHLSVVGGSATCVRVDAEADVECDVDVLGHLYLGGGDAMGMAQVGRVRGEPGDVRSMDRLFGARRAPWCPEVF